MCALLPVSRSPSNSSTLASLASKHPSGPPLLHQLAPGAPSIAIPDFVVKKMIFSFPAGSSPGPMGLRTEHLRSCLKFAFQTPQLEHLTNFINRLVAGKVDPAFSPFLAGATLSALIKNLVVFAPWPVVTCYVVLPPNAFVLFLRMLFVISFFSGWCFGPWRLRKLVPYFLWCYASPSNLFFDTHIISSEIGIQQGDPMAPFLFSLALQNLVSKIGSSFPDLLLNRWYLDDGNLAGDSKWENGFLSSKHRSKFSVHCL